MRILLILLVLFGSIGPIEAQGDHSNYVTFRTSGKWTIPNGVTQLTIEAWGGGGGGSSKGGGQGGGYFRITIPLPPTSAGVVRDIHYDIGQGGADGAAAGMPGMSTTISYNNTGLVFTAHGGAGNNGPVNDNNAGTFDALTTAQLNQGTYSLVGANGQFGSSAKILSSSPGQSAGTTYISAVGGDGGEAGHAMNTRGHGGSEFFITNMTSTTQNSVYKLLQTAPSPGAMPGGGGGGSADVAPPINGNGSSGASGGSGMVVFSWN